MNKGLLRAFERCPRAGDIVEIHNTDGTGCLISNDPTTKFAGAGITTTAPVIAPPAVN
jgi:hypothetical protein